MSYMNQHVNNPFLNTQFQRLEDAPVTYINDNGKRIPVIHGIIRADALPELRYILEHRDEILNKSVRH